MWTDLYEGKLYGVDVTSKRWQVRDCTDALAHLEKYKYFMRITTLYDEFAQKNIVDYDEFYRPIDGVTVKSPLLVDDRLILRKSDAGEVFYYFPRATRALAQHLLDRGVYLFSALTHNHISTAFTLVARNASRLDRVLAKLGAVGDDNNGGVVANDDDPDPDGDGGLVRPIRIVRTYIAARHRACLVYARPTDCQFALAYYLNFVHDYQPHECRQTFGAEMRLAEHLGIAYSQDRDAARWSERILSWDIECVNFDGNFPRPHIPDNCIQLMALGLWEAYRPVRYFALFHTRRLAVTTNEVRELRRRVIRRLRAEGHYVPGVTRLEVGVYPTEASMLERAVQLFQQLEPTLFVSYNGSSFDTPYLKERLRLLSRGDGSGSNSTSLPILQTMRVESKLFGGEEREDLFYPPAQALDAFLYLKVNKETDFKSGAFEEQGNNSLQYFSEKYLGESKATDGLAGESVVETTRRFATLMGYHPRQLARKRKFFRKKKSGKDANKCDGEEEEEEIDDDDNKFNDEDREIATNFIYYCLKDTILPVKLEQKFNMAALKRDQAEIMKCPSRAIFNAGITQQMPHLVTAEQRRMRVPPRPIFEMLANTPVDIGYKSYQIARYYGACPRIKKPYEGAIVRARPGRHENIAIYDFESLYPSVVAHQNISHETFLVRPRQILSFTDAPDTAVVTDTTTAITASTTANAKLSVQKFARKNGELKIFYTRRDVVGVFPQIMRSLKQRRKAIKARIKDIERALAVAKKEDDDDAAVAKREADEQLLRVLNVEQNACKLIANSAYGACVAGFTPCTSIECAEKITSTARSMFFQIHAAFHRLGLEIVYGDTDSIMVRNISAAKARHLDERIREAIARHWPGGDMNLEYEDHLPLIIIFSSKRYSKIRDDGRIESKGLKAIRGDTIPLLRHAELDVIAFIRENRCVDLQRSLYEYGLRRIRRLPDEPLRNFVKSCKIKNSSEYKNPGANAGVLAVVQKIKAGYAHTPNDRIYMIFLREPTSGNDDDDDDDGLGSTTKDRSRRNVGNISSSSSSRPLRGKKNIKKLPQAMYHYVRFVHPQNALLDGAARGWPEPLNYGYYIRALIENVFGYAPGLRKDYPRRLLDEARRLYPDQKISSVKLKNNLLADEREDDAADDDTVDDDKNLEKILEKMRSDDPDHIYYFNFHIENFQK